MGSGYQYKHPKTFLVINSLLGLSVILSQGFMNFERVGDREFA